MGMELDVDVKILGPGCKKCEAMASLVHEVAKEQGLAVQIEKITSIETIAEFGVMATPALALGGDVKCAGRLPDKAELLAWLKKQAACT